MVANHVRRFAGREQFVRWLPQNLVSEPQGTLIETRHSRANN